MSVHTTSINYGETDRGRSGGKAYGQVSGRKHPVNDGCLRKAKPREPKPKRGNKRAVLVDGKRYESGRAADKALGLSINTITSTLNQGRTRYKNHEIRWAE